MFLNFQITSSLSSHSLSHLFRHMIHNYIHSCRIQIASFCSVYYCSSIPFNELMVAENENNNAHFHGASTALDALQAPGVSLDRVMQSMSKTDSFKELLNKTMLEMVRKGLHKPPTQHFSISSERSHRTSSADNDSVVSSRSSSTKSRLILYEFPNNMKPTRKLIENYVNIVVEQNLLKQFDDTFSSVTYLKQLR